MKNIFLLVFLFVVCKIGYAQYPMTQYIGTDSAVVVSKGAMQSRFINVVFADTTAANLQRIKQYPGAMIYASGKLWVRNTTATKWDELTNTSTNVNIYNSNGVLTGDRILNGNVYSLAFDNLSNFEANVAVGGKVELYQGNKVTGNNIIMSGDTTAISRRMTYNSNLGSSFTKHSLVDKNYVDSITATGLGTVTSVATNNGTGITGGTITTSGTLAIDTNLISTRAWRQKGVDSVVSVVNTKINGTTNYVSKFTGANSIGNSQIFDNGSSIGIGTTTPNFYPDYKLLALNSVEGGIVEFMSNNNLVGQIFNNSTQFSVGTQSTYPLTFITNQAERVRITASGNMGVGTGTPDSSFQVLNGAYFQRGVRMSGLPSSPGTKSVRIDANGRLSVADTLVDAGGTVTSVATNNGTGITGGTITTTGTLAIDTTVISTRAWRQKGIDSVASLIGVGYVPYVGATQNLNLGQFGLKTEYVEFDTTLRAPADRTLSWSNDDGTLYLGMTNGGTITQRIGLEQFARVKNVDSVTISKGEAVYIYGASGDRASVKRASNKNDSTSSRTLGVAAENIAVNGVGIVGTFGVVFNLNMSAYNPGDVLYLDSLPGQLTKTKPQAPYHIVFIGVVERANSGNGLLFVNPQNGYELDELHNVRITSPIANKSLLMYDSTRALWVDTTVSSAGLAVTSVATNTGTGITGGTITTTGTLAIDTLLISTRAWRQKGIDSVQSNLTAGLATKLNISDTSSMLSPYLRKVDTTAMLSPYLRSNVAAATYVPLTRTITINGTSQDLSANRTYNVGTVTSVATNTGTGITGGTITTSGTIAADTLLLSTRAWRQKGIDSVASLINTNISGTTNYFSKFTGTNSIGNSLMVESGFNTTTNSTFAVVRSDSTVADSRIIIGGGNFGDAQNSVLSLLARTNGLGPTTFTQGELTYSRIANQTGKLEWKDRINGSLATRFSVANGKFNINNVPNATIDTDKFMVLDGDTVEYRTGAQVLSDIGAASASSISGTTNYVSKFSSSSTIGNSQIFDNGTNVGINTTTGNAKLDIDADNDQVALWVGGTQVTGANANSLVYFTQTWNTTGNPVAFDLYINNTASGANAKLIDIRTDVGTQFQVTKLGLVGVNTSSPDSSLTVENGTHLRRGVRMSGLPTGVGTKALRINANGQLSIADTLANGVSGTGTTNYVAKFTGTNAVGNSQIFDNGTNVGIGTTSPAFTLDVNGTVRISNSASLRFTNTTNTSGFDIGLLGGSSDAGAYIYQRASSPMVFATANTERMRLDASGNLGLGTSSPNTALVSRAFTIDGTINSIIELNYGGGTRGAYLFSNSANTVLSSVQSLPLIFNTNDTERMRLDASGNLGLGTSSPQSKFHLYSAVGTATELIRMQSDWNNPSGNKSITWADATNVLGRISVSYSAPAAKMTFGSLYNSGYQSSDLMTLDASGNLGLGTSSPAAKLDISAGTNLNLRVKQLTLDNFSNDGVGITFTRTSTDDELMAIGVADTDKLGMFSREGLIFATGGASTYSPVAERMRITSGGLVGIGTSSPSNILQITAAAGSSHVRWTESATTIGFVGGANGIISGLNGSFAVRGESGLVLSGAGNAANVYINSSGNVGIGTSSPDVILHVSGTTGTAKIASTSTTAANYPYLTFLHAGNDEFRIGGGDGLRFLSSGTTERMRITSGGNVGIGTTSPSSILHLQTSAGTASKLYLGQSATAAWSVGNNASANTFSIIDEQFSATRLFISSTGNIGIGTTSPGTKLQVVGTIAAQINADGSDATGIRIYGSGTSKRIDFVASDGNVNERISGIGTGGPGIMTFAVNNDVATLTERMRITSGGNVGIGTTSPNVTGFGGATALTIQASIQPVLELIGSTYNASGVFGGGVVQFRNSSSSVATLGVENLTGNQGNMVFYTNNGSNDFERMRITSGGLVGIGTTSPAARLEVQNGTAGADIRVSNTGGGYAQLAISSNATSVANLSFTNSLSLIGGNVGIGTTSPAELLEVSGSSNVYAKISSSNGANAGVRLNSVGVREFGIFSDGSLRFYDFTASTERMRITSGGELLINTTSDAGDYKLQVNGASYMNNLVINRGGGSWDITPNNATNFLYFRELTGSAYPLTLDGTNVRVGINTTTPTATLEVNGSIKTAAPSGGTAKPWKLGAKVAQKITLDDNNYIEVEIDGVAYKLALAQ